MSITLNGEKRSVPDGSAVSDLLARLGLPQKTVLVEQNGRPLSREVLGTTAVCEGDCIELIQMVAGG